MITVPQAHTIIQDAIQPIKSEYILLKNALGRVLASDFKAPFSQPRFDNSAMDGYAVKWQDVREATTETPAILMSIGTIPAGTNSETSLEAGFCTQIMTGAPIPHGADAVIMVEQTNGFDTDNGVHFYKAANSGQNIRCAAEEIRLGSIVITSGVEITPAELGVLATFGQEKVKVIRQAKVAILSMGDELREPGEKLNSGEIFNSNQAVLKALIEKTGAEIHLIQNIKDDAEALDVFLKKALVECDVLLTTGGISMGKYDLVRKACLTLGVDEKFWKVAQKPGKPLFFGTKGSTLIFGLPGNPISTFICFMEFVAPVITRRMNVHGISKTTAILASGFPTEKKKHRFLFGRAYLKKGTLYCEPTNKQGSQMLSAALFANCIIESPPTEMSLTSGIPVIINLLPWRTLL